MQNVCSQKCHHHLISTQDLSSTAVQYSLLNIQLRTLNCAIPLCVYELISGYVVNNTTVYV